MTNPLDPDNNYQIHNEQIEGVLKDIGSRIASQIPKGWGFNLAIGSYGEKGSTFYISNMEREGAADFLQELIDKRLRPGKPRERYPEIKHAIGLLQDWLDISESDHIEPHKTKLKERTQDYIDNV